MPKYATLIILLIPVIFLSGCATIMTGSTQKVPVNSNPSGAVAKVDGGMAAVTPTIFNLERKTDHTIEISKEGYRTAQVILRHTLSGATCGNLLVGGIIGIAVDGCSGAMFKLVPERVDATLERSDTGSAVISPSPDVKRSNTEQAAGSSNQPISTKEWITPVSSAENKK